MKRCAILFLLSFGPAACKTTEPPSTTTGYFGIEKLTILAKGME